MISSGDAWGHMVKLYSLPGVMTQCLLLQEKAGVSVTALLTVIVSAAQGDGAIRPLTALAVVEASATYQSDVLQPLRRSRDGLKQWCDGEHGALAQELRTALLERELAAEGLEQALVLGLLSKPGARAGPDDILADGCRNVARYVTALGGLPDAFMQQSIAHILSAELEEYDGLHLTRVLDAALQEARLEVAALR